LLLQQGYRVDYAAASDAFTYAPEGFDEFFNQRRRWMPSTIANILDLLQDGNNTVAINNNISWLYIFYQGKLNKRKHNIEIIISQLLHIDKTRYECKNYEKMLKINVYFLKS